eukprot:scaffold443_cov527-Prasinococcus_capsulatus_cf.AAC.28
MPGSCSAHATPSRVRTTLAVRRQPPRTAEGAGAAGRRRLRPSRAGAADACDGRLPVQGPSGGRGGAVAWERRCKPGGRLRTLSALPFGSGSASCRRQHRTKSTRGHPAGLQSEGGAGGAATCRPAVLLARLQQTAVAKMTAACIT